MFRLRNVWLVIAVALSFLVIYKIFPNNVIQISDDLADQYQEQYEDEQYKNSNNKYLKDTNEHLIWFMQVSLF